MIPEGLKVLLMGAAGLLESHGEQHYADELRKAVGGADQQTKEEIAAIKDPAELRKAIAENLHLFQE